MENIINNIYLKNNKIYLDAQSNITRMCLAKDKSNFILPFEVEDNCVDLVKILETYSHIIPKRGLYALAIRKEEECKIVVNQIAPVGKDYICKDFKLNVKEEEFILDVYVNNINQVKINIKKVEKENPFKIVVDTIFMENANLNLCINLKPITNKIHKFDSDEELDDINTSEELNNIVAIENTPFIIFFDETSNIFKFEGELIEDNKLNFNIDLNRVVGDRDTTLSTLLIINNRVVELKLKDVMRFKPIMLTASNKLKKVVVKSQEENKKLICTIDGKVDIKPKITEVKYENGQIVLHGKLYSTFNVYQVQGYKATLQLVSRDKKIYIEDNLEISNDSFEYVISDGDLINLKRIFSGEWDFILSVKHNDEIIVSKDVYYKNKKDKSILSKVIKVDGYDTLFEAYLTKDKKKFSLRIKNKVTITQILTITKKKNNIIVKYRTKENVENLLDKNKILTNMFNEKETLEGKSVKKIGKKTYTVEYTSKDIDEFIEEIIKSGVSLVTEADGYKSLDVMSDINRYAIYYNKWDAIQNSRYYKKLCSILYNKLFLKLPIKKNRVLFESFLGRNVSGNPKYVYEYFVENNMDNDYELVWILNNTDEDLSGNGKKVKRKSLKYYYYMATSGYWVFNARQADEIVKRKNITYLQTWHGTPLKKLGGDMFNSSMAGSTGVDEYIERFFKNSSRWDYLLAQNDYSAEIFERAFNFKKKMLYGYPANDILYTKNNEKDINDIKDKLNIPKDKKVILYAPTWRDDSFYKKGHYKMSMELELDKMQKELGDEYIVLLRTHYLIANSINVQDYQGFVYDFSEGYDVQELYLVTDILITDYSSVMFDFANLRRPMVFFAYDLEKYRDSLRGFYFDFAENVPGPVAMTTDEVVDSIRNLKTIERQYKEKQEAFYSKFCHIDDGLSGKRIVEEVFLNNKGLNK